MRETSLAPLIVQPTYNRPHLDAQAYAFRDINTPLNTELDGDPPIVECGVGSKPHDLHVVVRFARCRDCLVEQGERTSGRCIVADGRSDA